jgi:hypothetical protein
VPQCLSNQLTVLQSLQSAYVSLTTLLNYFLKLSLKRSWPYSNSPFFLRLFFFFYVPNPEPEPKRVGIGPSVDFTGETVKTYIRTNIVHAACCTVHKTQDVPLELQTHLTKKSMKTQIYSMERELVAAHGLNFLAQMGTVDRQ